MQVKPIFFLVFISWAFCLDLIAQVSLEIYDIQGDQLISPYLGEQVQSNDNIVTAVGASFFFMQTPDSRDDENSSTSNGIYVFTGSRPNLEPGYLVDVTGVVQEWDQTTRLSVSINDIQIKDRDRELPSPICLSEDFPSPNILLIPDLESVEGMRICLENAFVCSPADDREEFYLTAGRRAFREPGIRYPGDQDLPVWDGNPEVFYCETDVLIEDNAAFIQLPAKSEMDAIGFFTENDGFYIFWPQSYDLKNPEPITRGVSKPNDNELSIGSFNIEVFSDDEFVYPIQLKKAARYIVELMQTPDILALQEIENLKVLNQLIDEIHELAPQTDYRPEIYVSNSFINTAYLLSPAVKDVRLRVLGENQRLSNGRRMHDRPPLLLEAKIQTDNQEEVPVKVFNLHLRSLNGIEGRDADEVRLKRHEAAISVARMIQSIQGPNLFVTGDFNAFQFSDGYVDVLAQLTGMPSLGAEYEVQPIVNPPLRNLTVEELPVEEQYSYIFRGAAQILDHLLASELEQVTLTDVSYIRGNADNADSYKGDRDVLFRVSDHDALIATLQFPGTINREEEILLPAELSIRYPNPFFPDDLITIELPEDESIAIRLFSIDGKLVDQVQQGDVAAGVYTFGLRSDLPFGVYVLDIQGKNYKKREKIVMRIE